MLFPFPEWKPDVSDFRASSTRTMANVLPRADGYGPMPSVTDLTSALPAACKGLFFGRKTDGTVVIFGATATNLYKLNNTDYTWSNVSLGGGPYSSVPTGEFWQFIQFNQLVIAVQANVVPQVYDLATMPAAFSNLGGSPPQARYAAVVARFIVLSGLLSNPFRIQWSGENAATVWTTGGGVTGADLQDLPDGGIVRGIGGGETGLILQDGGTRRMIRTPGNPVSAFQLERVSRDVGMEAPYSLVVANDKTLWKAAQGFYMAGPSGPPIPVGRERIDRYFLSTYDSAAAIMIGAADPRSSRVFWGFKSNAVGAPAGLFDTIIGYDTVLDRFIPPIAISGEFLARIAQPGLTLENLDAISGSLDALTQSLDSFAVSQFPELAIASSSHKVGLFRGANLEATLVTAEQSPDTMGRIFVRGLRPSSDATSIFASVIARDNQQSTTVTSDESSPNREGDCPQRASGILLRGKVRVPAGATWSYVTGVEADMVPDGGG